MDIGRGDEELGTAARADRLKVDETLYELLERIDVERIEIVGRQEVARRAPNHSPLARHEGKQPIDHCALQSSGSWPSTLTRAPEIGEPRRASSGSAAVEPVGEHDRVDRSRRGAGNPVDAQAAHRSRNVIEDAPR